MFYCDIILKKYGGEIMPIAKVISDYEQLKEYEFKIELENGKIISLIFAEENLKHLLGFQNIKPLKEHASYKIYNDLKSGKFNIINDSNLSLNNKIYKNKNVIEKINSFPFVKSQLFSPVTIESFLINFDKLKVSSTCQQGSDYLFHFESADSISRYHLGISLDTNKNSFFPRSFFIEKDNRRDKYIQNQIEIKIKRITRIKKRF